MYKVLFATGSLSQGGTEMFMMNVLRQIDRSRFQIDFCITSNEITPNRVEAESYGCKIYVLPSRRSGLLKYIKAQWSFMKEHAGEYDAVHWNGGNLSSFMGHITYKYYKIPVRIVHAHSSNAVGLHNKILHYIHRQLIGLVCTHFFACSSGAGKFFFKNKPSVIINNGIDVDKYAYNECIRNEVREELGLPSNAQVIGHVGRFDDNKNHSFLLDIFAEYSKSNINSYLLLVGQGNTIEDIKSKANKLGLSEKIIFAGFRNDVYRLMQAMDCFVMPSKFEGLPYVLVEAQCSGLPCVVSDTINYDVDITRNVDFVSFNCAIQRWVDCINTKLTTNQRTSQSQIISVKGYSIKDTVRYLEKVYSHQQ